MVENGDWRAVTVRGAAGILVVSCLVLLIQASDCAPLMCPPPDGVVKSGPVRRSPPSTSDTAGRPAPATEPPRAESLPNAVAPSPTAPSGPTVPPPGTPKGSPALDLTSFEKRLRETTAIGVFTKLSLKNQVDDLLEQLAAFHEGRGHTPLAKLRESYDLLLLKVLSLLQDKDPALARDIAASREALWNLLADPAKFANL